MGTRVSSSLFCCSIALLAAAAHGQVETTAEADSAMPQWKVLQSLRDFAGLSQYAAENAALPAAPANRVVFLGDSITRFWSRDAPFFPGTSYVNRGVEGQTTAQMLIRFRQDVIDLGPAAVIIQGGLADIAGFTGPSSLVEIESNLRSMVELARCNNIMPILVAGPPAADFPGRTGPEPAAQVVALNKWVESYCASAQCVVVDYHSALVGSDGQMREGVSDDGVHPNATGYALLKPLVEKAIATALGRRAGPAAQVSAH